MSQVYVCAAVSEIEQLYRYRASAAHRALSVLEQLSVDAETLLRGHANGHPAVATQLRNWLPGMAGRDDADLLAAALDLQQARTATAREHGFADWAAVVADGTQPVDEQFEAAVDAVVTGDIQALQALLAQRPDLAGARSAYGHRATLLHYIGANGVEMHRQKSPANGAAVAELLVAAGADVHAEANMYGGGQTTMGLLMSSAHPAAAGITDAVAQVLRAAGAGA